MFQTLKLEGLKLSDGAEAVLRRNRGTQAAKEMRETKQSDFDLSNRDLCRAGAAVVAEELKV